MLTNLEIQLMITCDAGRTANRGAGPTWARGPVPLVPVPLVHSSGPT